MKGIGLGIGRAFVIRLQEGEVLHEAIETFCRENGVLHASVTLTGAVGPGSVMVSGPKVPLGDIIEPQLVSLTEPCELTGAGTVFPDEDGNPLVHLHGSVGRKDFVATGDLRPRMVVWLVMEVVITELVGQGPVRVESDPRLKGKLLEVRRWHPKRFSGRPCITQTANRSRSSRT